MTLARSDFPLPDTEWAPTRPFWAAAARDELAIPRCEGCRRLHWYPEPRCRRCGSERQTWERMSGRGTLFTWVALRHAFLPQFAGTLPFVSALVALEEDPCVRVATRIVDCPPELLEVDMAVEAVFRPLEFTGIGRRVTAPFFRPLR